MNDKGNLSVRKRRIIWVSESEIREIIVDGTYYKYYVRWVSLYDSQRKEYIRDRKYL